MSKNTRIGREFAYILAKMGLMYLSPNCCFNGENKPSDIELGKMLIEPGCHVMTCPRCGKKLIVARRGSETEFNKVDIYEHAPDMDLKPAKQEAVVAASSLSSFEQLEGFVPNHANDITPESNEGFIAGIGRTIRGLLPYTMKNPAILSGRNH